MESRSQISFASAFDPPSSAGPSSAAPSDGAASALSSGRSGMTAGRSPSTLDGASIEGAHVEQCDAVEFLRRLPDASVDLIVTDTAYESLEKHRAIGTTTRLKHSKASSNDWFVIFPNARFPELFAEAYRVLKKNSHLYLFCDQETKIVAKPEGETAGFKFWKPHVSHKRDLGMGYHNRSRYELILFFEKGKRKLHDLSIPDILQHPRIRGGYPSEKPSEISEILIRQSSTEGDLVVDPFCGSGSVGVAARRLGRRFAGSDICAEAVEIAAERTAAAASPAEEGK
jgi:site-specific DNA-methyltransferase (adenine-specific)